MIGYHDHNELFCILLWPELVTELCGFFPSITYQEMRGEILPTVCNCRSSLWPRTGTAQMEGWGLSISRALNDIFLSECEGSRNVTFLTHSNVENTYSSVSHIISPCGEISLEQWFSNLHSGITRGVSDLLVPAFHLHRSWSNYSRVWLNYSEAHQIPKQFWYST